MVCSGGEGPRGGGGVAQGAGRGSGGVYYEARLDIRRIAKTKNIPVEAGSGGHAP